MKKTEYTRVQLTDGEHRALSDALRKLHYSKADSYVPFVYGARDSVASAVSVETRRRVFEDFRSAAYPRSLSIIEGVPVEETVKRGPINPADAEAEKSTSISE